jgi:hypothetical protein
MGSLILPAVEDTIRDEWRAHTVPAIAAAGVEAAAREYAQAGLRLDKTVAVPRRRPLETYWGTALSWWLAHRSSKSRTCPASASQVQ